MKKTFLFLSIILIVCQTLMAQDKDNSGNLVSCVEYSNIFDNIKTICDKDNGKLWGINMYAPILCIDKNRDLWSNQRDPQDQLLKCGECFIGKYPIDKNIANSTTNVFGQKWVMLALPIPTIDLDGNILFWHELFHYWQDSLGHVSRPYNNAHLEAKDARVLLKLEWNAFLSACKTNNSLLRQTAIRDGLTFRKHRQQKYSKYYRDETSFEILEGLAEYTGIKLSVLSDSMYLHILDKKVETYMQKENLVRTYAYLSGAIMGYLLDKSTNEWRKHIDGNSDLGSLLQQTYNIVIPTDRESQIQQRKALYDYENIICFENRRDSIQAINKKQLIELFTQDIKKLPLKNMQISFDPNSTIPLENIGNIYKNARIVDDWGILETKGNGSILISEDWKTVILPDAKSIKVDNNVEETESWKLTFKGR